MTQLILLSALFYFTPHCAAAAEAAQPQALTAAGAAAAATTGNAELAAARRRLAELEGEAAMESAYPNPALEFEKGEDGYEAKVSQPIHLTRRSAGARAAAAGKLRAAQTGIKALETAVSAQAAAAWYALRIAGERLNFERTNLKFSMDLLNRIELRLTAGEAGNADLARAKVETARSGYRLRQAETAVKAAEAGLNFLLGRGPQEPLLIADGNFRLAPDPAALAPLEKYTGLAVSRRAEPAALAFKAEAASLDLALEKDKRLPVPEVGLIRGGGGGENYSRLFFGIELPLWDRNKGAIKRAEASKAALAWDKKAVELRIRSEVYQAWLELDLAARRLETARETVRLTNELRRAASQDYLSGKTGLAAYYETNRLFLEENINYLDALEGYYTRSAALNAAAGTSTEEL